MGARLSGWGKRLRACREEAGASRGMMVLLGPQMHLQKEVGLAGYSVVNFDRAMCVLFGNVDEGRWENDREIADWGYAYRRRRRRRRGGGG